MKDDVSLKKILFVDDDMLQLELVSSMLKDEYLMILARSGNEALEHLNHGIIPHLILLDILMPDMDGWETFNKIRGISVLVHVPIVFLTSVTADREKKRAIEIGAADYITKPIKRGDLKNRIKNAIDMFEKKEALHINSR